MSLWLGFAALAVAPAQAGAVRAQEHDAFWLWAGVKPHPAVATARTLYLLQGEIGPAPDGTSIVKPHGAGQPGPHGQELWLVYRVRALDFTPEVTQAIARRLARWKDQPGPLAGVQLDFDAGTKGLAGYAVFLRGFRASLPPEYRLGVTGLMDWASQGRPEDLEALAGTVDEIVFQTYRGRVTIPDIDAYVRRLGRLTIPFKLGLAEGAWWEPPADLAGNPRFRGYVIFLQNGSR